MREAPLRSSLDIEVAGAYSISVTIFAQLLPEFDGVALNVSTPNDESKEQINMSMFALLNTVVGDAAAPQTMDEALYLYLSRSSVALYPLLKLISSDSVGFVTALNSSVEEDILHP